MVHLASKSSWASLLVTSWALVGLAACNAQTTDNAEASGASGGSGGSAGSGGEPATSSGGGGNSSSSSGGGGSGGSSGSGGSGGSSGSGGSGGSGGSLGCTSDADCDGATCDEPSGRCVECVDAGDCASAELCRASVCVPSCDSDRDCTPLGLLCDFDAGACASCLSHDDCTEEEYCGEGACQPDVCSKASVRCSENTIETCDESGGGYELTRSCTSTQTCLASGDGVTCEDWVCTAGATECEDDRTAIVCSEDGLSVDTRTSCDEAGQYCVNGACTDQLCSPNTLFCSGGNVHECAADGLSSSLSASCASNQFCDDSGTATCTTRLCTPNEPTCNGNSATTCNAEGSGYTGGETDCGSLKCISGSCEEGYLLEDFEDGDYAGWFDGTGSFTRTVTSSYAADGTNYSFQLTGSGAFYDGIYYDFDEIQPSYVSYWCRTADTAGASTYFVLSAPGSVEYDNQIVMVYFYQNQILVAIDSYVVLAMPSPNQWYHIEMDLDWSAKVIDFTVDDVLVASNVSFRVPSVPSVARLDLFSLSSTTAYWDEIVIR